MNFPDNNLSDNERTRRRQKQFRLSPNEYLQLAPEQKRERRLAMAALMGMDDDTTQQQRIYISQAIASHCPRVLEEPANLRAIVWWSHDKAIRVILAALSRYYTDVIVWDYDLAFQAIVRNGFYYQSLPSYLKNENELWLKAMETNPTIFQRVFEAKAAECYDDDDGVVLQIVRIATERVDDELRKQFERILQRSSGRRLKECFETIARRVKPEWDNHVAFQTFLTCITAADLRHGQQIYDHGTNDGNHPLQMMICGEETSVALKCKIAEFLGSASFYKLKQTWSVVERFFIVKDPYNGDKREKAVREFTERYPLRNRKRPREEIKRRELKRRRVPSL